MTAPDLSGTSVTACPVARLGLRRGALVFVLFWSVFAGVHYEEPGWNVNSRFALTRAIVERGTFEVTGYVDQPGRDTFTMDRSIYDGRYYSDKVIGTSLLGVVPYGLIRLVAAALGAPLSVPLARYLTTIFSVSLCAALLGPALMSLALAYGASLSVAFFIALAMGFGTMLWGYSSLFMSYLPAACCTVLAWNLLLRMRLAGGGSLAGALGAGFCLGGALLFEYTAGIAVAALGVYGLAYLRPWRRVGAMTLAGAVPLALFAAYTLICFGEVCIPYKYLEDPVFRAGMDQGLQGITGFRPAVLYFITVHPYRGVFVLSPFLGLALVGLVRMAWRAPRFRADAALCGTVFAGYLFFNASYYMWWGGWSLGPRHLIPGLVFLAPPLIWLLQWNRWWALALTGAVVVSVWMIAAPTLVDPQPPHGPYSADLLFQVEMYMAPYLKSPVLHHSWPAFLEGATAWRRNTPPALQGPWYFLALLALWGGGAWRLLRRPAPPPPKTPPYSTTQEPIAS